MTQHERPSRVLIAANDNHPDRLTMMIPHNGGCSTTSGLVPVSTKRVGTNEAADDADIQAGLAVTEYCLQVAA